MKVLRNIAKTLLLMLPLLTNSCTVDDEKHYYTMDDYPDAFHIKRFAFRTHIRFEDAEGNNLLESFSDIPSSPGFTDLNLTQHGYLHVKCVRESDKAEMTFSQINWYNPENNYEREEVYGPGPMLYVNWLDMDLYSGRNPNKTYDETYTIIIQNSRVWGEKVTHTIQWYIHVEHEYVTVTQCLLDGESINLWNSKEGVYMNGLNYTHNDWRPMNGLVHIKTEGL